MPPLTNPLADVPAALHKCPWHADGVVGTNLNESRFDGEPVFPTVLLRFWTIRYECGCVLQLDEDLTAARVRKATR